MSESNLCEYFFGDELQKRLTVLKENGYQFLGVSICQTCALSHYLEATFSNKVLNRVVRANYLPSTNECPDVLKIFVEIERKNSFSIDEFLRFMGRPNNVIESVNINAYEGDEKNRLSMCLDNFNRVLRDDLQRIISGVDWIDVPIVWDDYK